MQKIILINRSTLYFIHYASSSSSGSSSSLLARISFSFRSISQSHKSVWTMRFVNILQKNDYIEDYTCSPYYNKPNIFKDVQSLYVHNMLYTYFLRPLYIPNVIMADSLHLRGALHRYIYVQLVRS